MLTAGWRRDLPQGRQTGDPAAGGSASEIAQLSRRMHASWVGRAEAAAPEEECPISSWWADPHDRPAVGEKC